MGVVLHLWAASCVPLVSMLWSQPSRGMPAAFVPFIILSAIASPVASSTDSTTLRGGDEKRQLMMSEDDGKHNVWLQPPLCRANASTAVQALHDSSCESLVVELGADQFTFPKHVNSLSPTSKNITIRGAPDKDGGLPLFTVCSFIHIFVMHGPCQALFAPRGMST
jgi:hypothetical protein